MNRPTSSNLRQLPLVLHALPTHGRNYLSCMAALVVVALGSTSARAQAPTNTSPDVGVRFQPPNVVVLINAHIFADADRQLPDSSLIVRDGKIAALGPNVPIPAGAEVIDCAGKHIYPAFVDAFTEADNQEADFSAGYWNAFVTPQRRMDELGKTNATELESLRKTGIAVVLAAPRGGIIKGQSCVVTTSDQPLERRLLRGQAFQHMRLYPERSSRNSYPNSPMGAVALVRQTMLDADWYQHALQAVAAARDLPSPEVNTALAALLPAIRAEQAVMIDGTNELYTLRADRLAREFSLNLIIRGSGREYRALDAIAGTSRPLIVPINFPDAPKVDTDAQVAEATLQSLMHWRLAPENPARLERAGVRFALSTDGLDKVSDLLPKVRLAIERGLSQRTALRALTEIPAELLGISQQTGSLEVGKLANLLISDGEIFQPKSEIVETWIQGERYQWKKEQSTDLRGSWSIAFSDRSAEPLELKLTGTAEKLKANLHPTQHKPEVTSGDLTANERSGDDEIDAPKRNIPDTSGEKSNESAEKTVELKNVQFDGFQLKGTFESKGLHSESTGRSWFSATALADSDSLTLCGSILWSDGLQNQFVATRTGNESQPSTVETDEETSDKPSSESVQASAAQPAQKSPEAGDNSATLVACEVNFPLGAYGRTSAPDQPEYVLVHAATVWTCGPDGTLENADLLIHNGIIESVGQNLPRPANAVVIDGTGLHVSPGIIDCHSHMATDGGVNESAQAVTAEVRIGDFIDPNDITIYRQLAGGVTTSNILHGSANPIGGQNQVIKLRWGALDEELKMREAPAGIKFALGENVKQSNWGEGYNTRYPQSRMGVEQIMRDRFEAAKLYRQRWQDWSASPKGLPPRRDLELEAIAEILEGKRWIHCHSYRQDEILTMLHTLDDYNVTIGSLQHILEGYKVADAMAAHGAMGSSFSDWWAYKFEVLDAIPYNGAIMHQAGVVVSFNSDDDELARHLNHEAAKAIKYGGVEPAEALKFVTLNPAKQLRIERWVGSLEAGKHADFVIWNRSPLSTLSACQQTWIDGRKYFDRAQDLRQREQDATLHRQLIQSVLAVGAGKGADDSQDPSTWWVRHDEFCHHGHDEDHEH